MATLVAAPVPYPEPNYRNYDHEVESAREYAYTMLLADKAQVVSGSDRLIGRTIRFSVADGYAQYLVWSVKPLQLVHLPFGDAYSVSAAHIRGLTVRDVQALVDWEDQWIRKPADEQEAYYASLPIGSIVHYDNGFGKFIRCERIEGGRGKRLRPLALVGNWEDSFDLPRRMPDGSIHLGYHAEAISEGQPFEPHYTSIWENMDAERRTYSMRSLANTDYLNEVGKARFAQKRYQAPFDPTAEPAIDLSVPEPTEDEQALAEIVQWLQRISNAAAETPETLADAQKQLREVADLADQAQFRDWLDYAAN